MDPIHALVDRHLSTWNSPPGDERAAEIAAVYTDDVFVGEPEAAYTGHGGVEQAISGLQSAIPGMALSLRGGIQTAQDMTTYAWELGPGGAPPVATGRDVIMITEGRISRIYVVIDAP